MIVKPTNFVKPKTETEAEKKTNQIRSASKKLKGNFSSGSVSKEKVQALFKKEPSVSPSKPLLQTERNKRNLTTFNTFSKGRDQTPQSNIVQTSNMDCNKAYLYYTRNDPEWKKLFLEIVNVENSVDISGMIPILRNCKGEILLQNSKFWTMLIEFKKATTNPKLNLEQIVKIFDESLKFDLSNMKIFYEYFVENVAKFNKKIIFELLKKSKKSAQNCNLPKDFTEVQVSHYRFLLDFPDHFSPENLNKENNFSTNCKRSKITKQSMPCPVPLKLSENVNQMFEKTEETTNIQITEEIAESVSKSNLTTERKEVCEKFENNEEKKEEIFNIVMNECEENKFEEHSFKNKISSQIPKEIHVEISSFGLFIKSDEKPDTENSISTLFFSLTQQAQPKVTLSQESQSFFSISDFGKKSFNKENLTIVNENNLLINKEEKQPNTIEEDEGASKGKRGRKKGTKNKKKKDDLNEIEEENNATEEKEIVRENETQEENDSEDVNISKTPTRGKSKKPRKKKN